MNASLETGSVHVGQFIKKEYRELDYCTQGLKLLIEEAHKIVPEAELYLHCNIDNPASLRVMIKNGGVIHHKDQSGCQEILILNSLVALTLSESNQNIIL